MGLSIKKGDTVRVISGLQKGATGRVLACFPKKGTALVEGVAMVKKHMRQRGQQQGGIMERERPIPVSKLMLVDPKTGRAARFSNDRAEGGNKIRRSKDSGNEV